MGGGSGYEKGEEWAGKHGENNIICMCNILKKFNKILYCKKKPSVLPGAVAHTNNPHTQEMESVKSWFKANPSYIVKSFLKTKLNKYKTKFPLFSPTFKTIEDGWGATETTGSQKQWRKMIVYF